MNKKSSVLKFADVFSFKCGDSKVLRLFCVLFFLSFCFCFGSVGLVCFVFLVFGMCWFVALFVDLFWYIGTLCLEFLGCFSFQVPKCSMYGIFTYIYQSLAKCR